MSRPRNGDYIHPEHMASAQRKAGLRNYDLAQLLGVSETTISRMRNSEVTVDSERLRKLSEVLQVSEVYLLNVPQWFTTSDGRVLCSMCYNECPMYKVTTDAGTKARKWTSLYCPHCGAKMRNGRER